jgi:hypothetical protein
MLVLLFVSPCSAAVLSGGRVSGCQPCETQTLVAVRCWGLRSQKSVNGLPHCSVLQVQRLCQCMKLLLAGHSVACLSVGYVHQHNPGRLGHPGRVMFCECFVLNCCTHGVGFVLSEQGTPSHTFA